VLTVGDGDLSFSLALARVLLQDNRGCNIGEEATRIARRGGTKASSGGNRLDCEVIATSYESRADVLRIYPSAHETVAELEALGARVLFNVDACNLGESLASAAQTVCERAEGACGWRKSSTAVLGWEHVVFGLATSLRLPMALAMV
jgi:hypothetical protein